MKFLLFIFSLFISTFGFAQGSEKKILFKGDSLWYASKDQMLFSSENQGLNWDTIFAKRNPPDTVFFSGVLDTATNVFVSDQRTLFVFGWDGTMHHKTILYSSSDCGKTWSRSSFNSSNGAVGVKYFHKNSVSSYFIYLRRGRYAISTDFGKTWQFAVMINTKFGCFDDHVSIENSGEMSIGYSKDKACKTRTILYSKDGGITWAHEKTK